MASPRYSQTVQTPGEIAAPAEAAGGVSEVDALRVELAALKAQQAAAALPQVVFEPITPHAREKMLSSPTAHLTVAEVMAKIDAGEMPEAKPHYLCKDGYYAARV